MMRETVDWLMLSIEATWPCDLPSILTHWKIRWASPSGFQERGGWWLSLLVDIGFLQKGGFQMSNFRFQIGRLIGAERERVLCTEYEALLNHWSMSAQLGPVAGYKPIESDPSKRSIAIWAK